MQIEGNREAGARPPPTGSKPRLSLRAPRLSPRSPWPPFIQAAPSERLTGVPDPLREAIYVWIVSRLVQPIVGWGWREASRLLQTNAASYWQSLTMPGVIRLNWRMLSVCVSHFSPYPIWEAIIKWKAAPSLLGSVSFVVVQRLSVLRDYSLPYWVNMWINVIPK